MGEFSITGGLGREGTDIWSDNLLDLSGTASGSLSSPIGHLGVNQSSHVQLYELYLLIKNCPNW